MLTKLPSTVLKYEQLWDPCHRWAVGVVELLEEGGGGLAPSTAELVDQGCHGGLDALGLLGLSSVGPSINDVYL